MAETVRLLNPDKVVLIRDLKAGCSLAASITAADIRLLRERTMRIERFCGDGERARGIAASS